MWWFWLATVALLYAVGSYFRSWAPTEARWFETRAALGGIIDDVTAACSDAAAYYAATTDRDYRLLAAVTGSAAMHTQLVARPPGPFALRQFRQAALVLAHMGGAPGDVLEVGFGKGVNMLALAQLLPHRQFIGVDLLHRHVLEAAAEAARMLARNTLFLQGNAASPPAAVQERRYALVFGVESLCHLDTEEALDAFMRFAAGSVVPGGRLLLVDSFRTDAFHASSAAAQEAMRLAELGFRIKRMPARADWRRAAAKHGFLVAHEQDLTPQALPFWRAGWQAAQLLLLAPGHRLLGWYFRSAAARRETGASFLAVCCVANALALGSAEYGVLVLQRDWE